MTAAARKANHRPSLARREASAIEALAAVVADLLEPHTRAQRLAVEALAGQLVELRDDVAEFREQLRELREPPEPPDGYIALKVAAWRLGTSVETLRRRAVAGEVSAIRQEG